MTSRRLRAATAAVVLTALASACTAGGSGGGGDGSTLTVHTSFVIKTLDPGKVYEATGLTAVHAMYDTLLTFTGSDVSKPVPNLAESFTASPDATTYTFTLRGNAKFADGSPVTADDVVFSLSRVKNLKASPAVMVADLSAVKRDDRTVVVTSAKPDPNVPIILAMPALGVVNAKVAKQNGATDGADAAAADTGQKYLDVTSAGSGPYVLKTFDAAAQVVLEANPNYWGRKPAFTRVVIRNADVQNQKLTMAKATGAELALDITGKLLDGLPSTLRTSGVRDTVYFMYLNFDPAVSPVTSNPAFRDALRASIDYQGLADLFGKGAGPAAGLVPPAFPGALPDSDAPKQDLAKATELLKGIANPSAKFIYPAITYRGVDLGTVATKVQGDAAKAGIKLELTPQPLATFLDQMRGGKSEMGFSPQSLNYPVADSMVNNMAPGQGTALRAGWTVQRADPSTVEAGKKVNAALDPAARATGMQEWQRAMNKYSPYIALATNSGMVVATPSLTGAEYTPAGWQVDIAAIGRG
ncbi:ABC transporter substrate-binding protein [Actinocrispum wychmicini]|uniref:Peptide/nickel transport system substrate-binding protein n=1 Tax=Actinocrispum wychmicini TaxID=1213861 RepID=A0A4R2ILB5_9PSEU|nr:ABC transporter substrate-binding protein [Actinocrispum wychmicini]TCO45272.1 peptide/nickel transport system substrate-binding protein [Actinocrispum wychmicini]